MLTSQQKAHFDVFGFLAVRHLFTPDEVDIMTREFDAAMLEDREDKPFDGQKRQEVYLWINGRSAIEFLTADQRIHGPIVQLLGSGATTEKNFYGHLYVGDTGWHPNMGWDPDIPEGENDTERIAGRRGANHYVPSIKVAFY